VNLHRPKRRKNPGDSHLHTSQLRGTSNLSYTEVRCCKLRRVLSHLWLNFLFQNDSNTLTVNSIDSIRNDPNVGSKPGPDCTDLVIPVPMPGSPPNNTGFTTMTPQQIAQWIDKRSRVFFPAAFILFNVLYWGFVWI
jgi:hypothetical protein